MNTHGRCMLTYGRRRRPQQGLSVSVSLTVRNTSTQPPLRQPPERAALASARKFKDAHHAGSPAGTLGMPCVVCHSVEEVVSYVVAADLARRGPASGTNYSCMRHDLSLLFLYPMQTRVVCNVPDQAAVAQ